ncbi:YhbD family protein [Alicyclobacillus sp. ALC3]|uniref:YhbD family protein n=1 Tax=Alicyclobacillus sp. ALC3 TaxID=2796143 RepID=UPI00237923AD|nr:YhbD family protein [Alicyclobacillus sp. ALC3]WDL96089.1 YhbD family protein [Alicyclobacillus sp. ALC3]
MDQELISKKELLDLTGISYGQLYRWKRKNLIPEEWFIRKSSFTGQETFFPKEQILPRIRRILNMKDDLSLDEIAGQFSPVPEVSVSVDEVRRRGLVQGTVLDAYLQLRPGTMVFLFDGLLALYVFNRLLLSGDVNLQEGELILRVLEEHYDKFKGKDCEFVMIRKLGVATTALVSSPCDLFMESGAKVVAKLNLANCVEDLRLQVVTWEG